MKRNRKSNQNTKKNTVIAAGILSLFALAGCASSGQETQQPSQVQTQTQTQAADDTVSGKDTFRPSELAMPCQDAYEEPAVGIRFTVPKSLLERMENKEAAMLSETAQIDDNGQIRSMFFTWNVMTKEQLEAEVPSKGDGFYEWADGLERIGTLGICHTDQLDQLDELTKCTEHKELGKSADGTYTYYLSTNPQADKELTDAVSQIQAEITEMAPLDELNQADTKGIASLGDFSMQDIAGKTYTKEMFQDYKLTMINVFATWCTPCINEIPDLEKLYQEMADQGVHVVGIVLDAADGSGGTDETAVEKAKLLAERTGATYPFLIPDAGGLNGRLHGIQAVPETFFVDQDGKITGETYTGSNNLEGWKQIVAAELANLEGDQP